MKDNNKRSLLFVGLDGADWNIAHRLIDEGRMPCLESIVNQGVIGNLATVHPQQSFMLWTSIATGQLADRHGVHSYLKPRHDFVRPVWSSDRRSAAVWEILAAQQLRTHVIGWPAHPAEPTNGVFVSNLFGRTDRIDEPARDKVVPGCVYPAELSKTLGELRIWPEDLQPHDLIEFLPELANGRANSRAVSVLGKALIEAVNIQNAATWSLANRPWDFAAVYFDLLDRISHAFMAYHPPRQSNVSQTEFGQYQHVVTKAYETVDAMLDQLIKTAGADTTVMVASDHGFRSGEDRPQNAGGSRMQTEWHRPTGLFAIRGPGIKQDELIWGGSILDLSPTMLQLFDLPVADDMDGRPLTEALSTPREPAAISTWQSCRVQTKNRSAEQEIDAGIRKLINDGLIDNEHLAADTCQMRAEVAADFNLAQVLKQRGEFQSAADIFGKWIRRRPEVARYKFQLASCLRQLGREQEYRQIIEQAIGQGVSPALASKYLGNMELAAGNYQQALDHFFDAEQTNPDLPEIDVLIGWSFFHLKEMQQAELAFENALRKNQDDGQAHFGVGRVMFENQRLEQAIESFLCCVMVSQSFPQGHFWLGQALERSGMNAKAIVAYRRCLALRPDWQEPQQKLVKLKAA